MTNDEVRQTARELYGENDDLVVEPEARVIETQRGYWVDAVVFIPKENTP